jgi:SagB-type dehydrogenase family enzyme
VAANAGKEGVCNLGITPDKWTKVSHPDRWPEIRNYAGAIFERRSRRNFVKDAVPNIYVSALLECLVTHESRGPKARSSREHTICTGVLMERCEGFQSGLHMTEMNAESIGLVAAGSFMDKMAHICLDQTWLANSAIHFLFLANLDAVDRVWGPRGYRYAMMTAGRMGERLYLAATALGLGCCGIGAFYDLEGATLLGLNRESRLLYLVAVGPIKTKARE